jgi:pyruvate dehydrogenase E2 component (dihydrolipoamide acetyltransferase)
MPTPVVMPQMGESIAEGTIVRWIKKVGDTVDRDEPLFEISTDKVDAEIPSPAAGVLTEITVQEGETVAVNSVVATIGQAGDKPAAASAPAARQSGSKDAERAAASTQAQGDGQPASASAPPPAAARQDPAAPRSNGSQATAAPTKDDLRRQKSSPLVRRIAKEHNVDITQIAGSGIGGRVTKHDILGYLEHDTAEEPAPPAGPGPGARVEVEPLSLMRRKIAEHMILSRRTSAHVHSVFHVNFSALEKIRQQKKSEYERVGAKLTYMAFIAKAVVDALRRHPIVNASLDGDNIVYKKDINVCIAVALEGGLIVPVIRNADEKNLLGLSRAIARAASSSSRMKCTAARSPSPTRDSSARNSACRSSTSRRWPFSGSGRLKSVRSSSTMRLRSGRWRT